MEEGAAGHRLSRRLMRMLFLASRVPYPPDRGDRVRAYHTLRVLSEDHTIDLATFTERPLNSEARETLGRFCRRVEEVPLTRFRSLANAARGLLSSEPLQVWYYRNRRMATLVDRMARKKEYDLVYSHLFRVFPFALRVPGAYQLLDFTDVISSEVLDSLPHRPRHLRPLLRMEGGRIRRYEKWAASRANECWVISEKERKRLALLGGEARIEVVPNGVAPELAVAESKAPRRGRIGFLGHLEVFHNVDGLRFFIERVLPGLRSGAGGDRRLAVAGRGSHPEVIAMARREGVDYMGYVPDLAGFLRSVEVFIAPLRFAAGTQNKVLEAMAVGTPVVVSSPVLRGLGPGAEEAVLTADTPEQWVDRLGRLLDDPRLRREMGEAGRAFLRNHFSWDPMRRRLAEIERMRNGGR